MLEYAELCASSNFSFLRAASHPHELIERAAALQYRALAITDYNSLAGIVRAHIAAKKLGFKFHPGCRLTLFPGSWPQLKELLQHTSYEKVRKFTVFVYPTCLNSYGNLSQLLTTGKLRAPKGECYLTTDDFRSNTGGFVVIIALPEDFYPKKTQISDKFLTFCKELKDTIPRSHLSIAIKRDFTFYSIAEERVAAELSERFSIPPVASNMPLFHIPERKALHDVLSCIRKGCTLDQAGCLLLQNAERHLKPPAVMAKLFSDHPEALKRTTELSDLLSDFSLENLHYEYPEPTNATGDKAINHLKALVWQKAVKRYPAGVPLKVRRLLKEELKLIE
ncbi:MAG: PHP domain-containing protein, partial [Candidatus Dadabacteria bacterium]